MIEQTKTHKILRQLHVEKQMDMEIKQSDKAKVRHTGSIYYSHSALTQTCYHLP